ncbi:hypothetical protein NL676_006112 [Syzygium grande]|nr:hypothetical protein NL676_006112 [Syzygium grande]
MQRDNPPMMNANHIVQFSKCVPPLPPYVGSFQSRCEALVRAAIVASLGFRANPTCCLSRNSPRRAPRKIPPTSRGARFYPIPLARTRTIRFASAPHDAPCRDP